MRARAGQAAPCEHPPLTAPLRRAVPRRGSTSTRCRRRLASGSCTLRTSSVGALRSTLAPLSCDVPDAHRTQATTSSSRCPSLIARRWTNGTRSASAGRVASVPTLRFAGGAERREHVHEPQLRPYLCATCAPLPTCTRGCQCVTLQIRRLVRAPQGRAAAGRVRPYGGHARHQAGRGDYLRLHHVRERVSARGSCVQRDVSGRRGARVRLALTLRQRGVGWLRAVPLRHQALPWYGVGDDLPTNTDF